MRAYVGVTDAEWYRFLSARPEVQEVNFWQPSGGRDFRVISPGEPFFFKTHYPHNRVVGGGFFSSSARLTVSEAWQLFGEANGVDSIAQMRARIGQYRRTPIGANEDPDIGCLFVRDVRFFAHDATVDPPPLFARNIVQGKSSSTPRRDKSYICPTAAPTGLSASSWNGTSIRYSRLRDQLA